MDSRPYTSAQWRVKPGNEETFVEAWQELASIFLTLPQPPSWGILLRSVDDPSAFRSFGPWPSMEALTAMRADPRTGGAIDRLIDLCTEATPGAYTVAAAAGDRKPDS